ncbi:uncharacterized oxidoreductase YtbE-like [Oppia nitens]|uniref:uncharacterized oxidoreductase YtbE-like n=1 Tax=Oppia nitens TaxID=1686743 RepID=UPI0023DAE623|nr:uncharacterized oxidoreductase YtbE-like [Oppia nitens]
MYSLSFILSLITITFNSVNSLNVTKTFRLNNGVDIPVIGLGTGGFDGAPQGELVKQMVRDAIDVGYRLIDTAAYYGNEPAIGETIDELVGSGKVRREELFVSTKAFLLFGDNSQAVTRTETVHNVRLALSKLNQTYLDMMLFHWPSDSAPVNQEIWRGLEDALQLGLVRTIGVSNFDLSKLEQLLETAKVVPAVNQIESHPKLSQRPMIDFCNQYGIRMTAYSPLGAGSLVDLPLLTEIGNRYAKSAAQVMLRWQIQRGVVVIPKSTKRYRLIENINIFDFNLTDEEVKLIEDL